MTYDSTARASDPRIYRDDVMATYWRNERDQGNFAKLTAFVITGRIDPKTRSGCDEQRLEIGLLVTVREIRKTACSDRKYFEPIVPNVRSDSHVACN